MDPILKQKITDKLRAFLKREPLEHEIINGQNDSILMHWIADDDAAALRADVATTKKDIAQLKSKGGAPA